MLEIRTLAISKINGILKYIVVLEQNEKYKEKGCLIFKTFSEKTQAGSSNHWG